MAKSRDAFRTISEVADWLGIQAHVLRFWESKFTQIKPIKRAGGRRYYRPADMLLLGGIKRLLHDDGLTIKGVQKILREEGMSHVSELSDPLDDETAAQIEEKVVDAAPLPIAEPEPEEKGVVLSFEAPLAEDPVAEADPDKEPTPAPVDDVKHEAPTAAAEDRSEKVDDDPTPMVEDDIEPTKDETVETLQQAETTPTPESAAQDVTETKTDPDPETAEATTKPAAEKPETEPAKTARDPEPSDASGEPAKEADVNLPAFLRRPLDPAPAPSDNSPSDNLQAAPEPVEEVASVAAPEPVAATEPKPSGRKPRVIDIAPFTPKTEFDVSQSVLTNAYRLRRSSPNAANEIKPLLARLTTLRDSMAARRRGADAVAPKD